MYKQKNQWTYPSENSTKLQARQHAINAARIRMKTIDRAVSSAFPMVAGLMLSGYSAFCVQAYAEDSADLSDKASSSETLPAQRGVVLTQAAEKYVISKNLLLAAGTDGQGGVSTQPALTGNSLPGEKSSMGIELNAVTVRAKRFQNIGPMPGLSLTKEQIPGNIQSISAKEIKEAHSLSISELLNSKLQSVNVNDYQGNPFQMDVTYRGFTASPQIGSPQGLTVFFDGIRVNEPFGDVVNWDMIPMNALASFDVIPGSNPLYGLGTLGGAISIKTKSGFDSPGVSADILTGSFGRRQFQGSAGWNNGTLAAFGSVNLFMEDGWRQNSPSKVNQAFGKVEWQGERLSLGLSTLAVVNKLVGNGTVPQELYREDPTSVFTSPDETKNRLLQFQITAAFDFNDQINMTGQIYNRDSDRKSNTGDILDKETFTGVVGNHVNKGTRNPSPGEQVSCALGDDDKDGVPNYYRIKDSELAAFQSANPDYIQSVLVNTSNGPGSQFQSLTFNAALPADLLAGLQKEFSPSSVISGVPHTQLNIPALQINGENPIKLVSEPGSGILYTDGGIAYRIFAAPPLNVGNCVVARFGIGPNSSLDNRGALLNVPEKTRDGAIGFAAGSDNGSGVITGTPTAVITKSNIQQSGHGASVQLNFNYDYHKAMIGISMDNAKSSYVGKQRYGLLDNQRNVYNDPQQLGLEYYAADHDVTINDFSGKSSTKSIYASETWSPIKTLNFSASARYNYTDIQNTLQPRTAESKLSGLLNQFAPYITCAGNVCPFDLSNPLDYPTWVKEFNQSKLDGLFLTNGINGNQLDKAQTEKFSYHSLNPAFGVTWQAKSNLNLYGNWNQGTRAPSVIELGCAYDDTLVPVSNQPGAALIPRSLRDKRGCALPSALSGDPYLPQVVAQTIEFGARGRFKEFMEWNISAYRTGVKDDIYLTSLSPELSFFQSIGDTRRQGIEFGMAGEYGRSDFRINYSLTEATFQSDFRTLSSNNSAAGKDPADLTTFQQIDVKKGNVMPGVPFNNMNFNWGYKVTRDLKFNLSLVAHSGSFLRGNENNAHTPTQGQTISSVNGQTIVTPDNEYSGTAPGYAVLNFSARYNLGKGWAASVRINNLLDKQYYTAGRLGINPFAPSTLGAIGPGGFNYNSNEWVPSQFISGGAPRGIWGSLSYDFDASKKYDPAVSSTTMVDPDRTLEQPSTLPSTEEIALMRQMDSIKALPVLNRTLTPTQTAKMEVTANVESWRKALAENNAEAYLKLYSPTYSPPGNSRNKWAEQQKLQLTTERIQSAEVNNLMVGPQGKRMVAVFTNKVNRGDKSEMVRKVLTFEQKEGQWQITRERALPAYTVDAGDTGVKPSQSSSEEKANAESKDKPRQQPTRPPEKTRTAYPGQFNFKIIDTSMKKNSVNTDTAFVEVAK